MIEPEDHKHDADDHHHHAPAEIDDTLKPPNKVNIWISCKHLPNLEVFSKTDPYVIISIKEANAPKWIEIGRTEEINDNLDPEFQTMISVNYYFEK